MLENFLPLLVYEKLFFKSWAYFSCYSTYFSCYSIYFSCYSIYLLQDFSCNHGQEKAALLLCDVWNIIFNLSPRTHNGPVSLAQLDNQVSQLITVGFISVGQSCEGHQNKRNSRMNRYTIANTSEFQRCLLSI